MIRRAVAISGSVLLAMGLMGGTILSQAKPVSKRIVQRITVRVAPSRPTLQNLVIQDPFQADPGVVPTQTGSSSGVGSLVGRNGQPPALVPGLGALNVPDARGLQPGGSTAGAQQGSGSQTFTLQATLLGHPSLAEFETGDNTVILREGEHLGDRVIAHIQAGEVIFGDGSAIALAASGGSPNSSAMPAAMYLGSPVPQQIQPRVSIPTPPPARGTSATPAPVNATPNASIQNNLVPQSPSPTSL
jgi:hypothetical protein